MGKKDIHQFVRMIVSKVDERNDGTEESYKVDFNCT